MSGARCKLNTPSRAKKNQLENFSLRREEQSGAPARPAAPHRSPLAKTECWALEGGGGRKNPKPPEIDGCFAVCKMLIFVKEI